MGRKVEITERQLVTLMAFLTKQADEPLDFELSTEPTDFDFESHARSPAPTETAKAITDPLPPYGTHPVCIRIPVATIRAFKAKATRSGSSYQTLMNKALRAAAAGLV